MGDTQKEFIVWQDRKHSVVSMEFYEIFHLHRKWTASSSF